MAQICWVWHLDSARKKTIADPSLAQAQARAQAQPRPQARTWPRWVRGPRMGVSWGPCHFLWCFSRSTRLSIDQVDERQHNSKRLAGTRLIHDWFMWRAVSDGPWWSKLCFKRFKSLFLTWFASLDFWSNGDFTTIKAEGQGSSKAAMREVFRAIKGSKGDHRGLLRGSGKESL